MDLDGVLDGGSEAVGEPDDGARRQCPRHGEKHRSWGPYRGHLGSAAHDARRQAVPPAELAVAAVPVDSPAAVAGGVWGWEDGRAGQSEEQHAPRRQRAAAHQEPAGRPPHGKHPAGTCCGGEQPTPRRAGESEGRRQPAPCFQ
jgi:hypothetical protein